MIIYQIDIYHEKVSKSTYLLTFNIKKKLFYEFLPIIKN